MTSGIRGELRQSHSIMGATLSSTHDTFCSSTNQITCFFQTNIAPYLQNKMDIAIISIAIFSQCSQGRIQTVEDVETFYQSLRDSLSVCQRLSISLSETHLFESELNGLVLALVEMVHEVTDGLQQTQATSNKHHPFAPL